MAQRLGGSTSSGGLKGRVIHAVGFHKFDWNASVGALLLHIGRSKRLCIMRVMVVDGLPGWDEQQVRTALVGCATEIAATMRDKGIGDGCLDWVVPTEVEGRVIQLYPGFEKAPKRQQPRGPRSLLRKCPAKEKGKA